VLEVIILVCSLGLSPAECQEDSAFDVIHAPVETGSMMNCGLYGQAFVAQTSLAKRLDGTYLKIRCGSGHRVSADKASETPVASAFPAAD
jgi:hypothetical protein